MHKDYYATKTSRLHCNRLQLTTALKQKKNNAIGIAHFAAGELGAADDPWRHLANSTKQRRLIIYRRAVKTAKNIDKIKLWVNKTLYSFISLYNVFCQKKHARKCEQKESNFWFFSQRIDYSFGERAENIHHGLQTASWRSPCNEHVYSPNKAERQAETDYVQQSHTIKIVQ